MFQKEGTLLLGNGVRGYEKDELKKLGKRVKGDRGKVRRLGKEIDDKEAELTAFSTVVSGGAEGDSVEDYSRSQYSGKGGAEGREMLKGIFLEVKKKFEMAVGVLCQEKITIDPEDPGAVDHWWYFLYKTPNQAYQLLEDKVLLKLDWAKNEKTKSSLKKTVAFVDEGKINTDTEKIMARMDVMTIKMDARYKELQSRAKQPTPDLDDDDMSMSREEEAKFMQTFRKTCFYNDYHDRDSNRDNWRSSERNDYRRDKNLSNTDDKPYDLQKQFNDFMKSQQSTNAFVKLTFMDLKTQLETVAKNHQASLQNLKTKFDGLADKQSSRPSGSLPSNTQPNP
uniref:Probable ATP synthase 24 kDa subunit, mitochondrial n=1 Tax=Tanacetum cinerariifolium TaxID=118510 RepID=A0A6L2P3X5_TANCI|nr:probable ATP synthase 24 kDa subunit, mitochondrial [Tanacetum cinerariifolium]